MKTILRTVILLLVASIVAGAFSLAVNNTTGTAGTNEEGGTAVMTSTDGQTVQPMERPQGGDRDGGSLAGGLSGVLMTVAKLTGITVLVLLIQRAFSLLGNRKLVPTRQ